MANHFFSTNRGLGLHPADVHAATSTTAADDIELRIADGASLTKKDVNTALCRIMTFFNSRTNTTVPPL